MIEISRTDLRRVVVSIDPAVTSGEDSDDTGLIVVGRGPCQPATCKLDRSICTGHGYVLEDLTCHVAPREWARIAVDAYHRWGADRIVGEINNGGDLIGDTVHAIDPGAAYRQLRASRGKQLRAEPASALYDQGRVHHLGHFPELEEQMTTWTLDSKWSPDRLDALVWGLTELGLIGATGAAFLTAWTAELDNRQPGPPPELKHLPKHGGHQADDPVPLKRGCQHRWRAEANGITYCVLCGGHQLAEAADTVAAQTP